MENIFLRLHLVSFKKLWKPNNKYRKFQFFKSILKTKEVTANILAALHQPHPSRNLVSI